MEKTRKEKSRKFAFTTAALEKLAPPPKGTVYYRDERTEALALAVTANGAKVWYAVRWQQATRSKVRYRLGRFPDMTLNAARLACRPVVAQIASGVDLQPARQAKRHEQTIGGLFQFWRQDAERRGVKTLGEDIKRFDRYFKPWEGRRLSTMSKAEIQRLFSQVTMTKGPYIANRLVTLLSAMYNRAPDMGYAGANPTAGIRRNREERRERFLGQGEMKAFFAALAAEPSETIRDLLITALLTGARKSNVMAMAWVDVDLKAGLWRIPTTKSGKPVTLPLTSPVLALLARRRETASGPWVFPQSRAGRGATGHVMSVQAAFGRIVTTAKLKDVRPHDLRRSLASWMAINGTSLLIVGKMLGHSSPNSTAIYARLSDSPVRLAAENAAQSMLLAANYQLVDGELVGNPQFRHGDGIGQMGENEGATPSIQSVTDAPVMYEI